MLYHIVLASFSRPRIGQAVELHLSCSDQCEDKIKVHLSWLKAQHRAEKETQGSGHLRATESMVGRCLKLAATLRHFTKT